MTEEFLVKSVAKAFNALDFILVKSLGGHGSTLTGIAGHLGIQQTTTRNILKTMEQCGYVSRQDNHFYAPGVKCYDMQRSAAFAGGLAEFAKPLLHDAAMRTGETYVLASINNGKRVPILNVRGGAIINVEPAAAESQRIYSLVTTRIMLAYMDKIEINYFVKQNGLPCGDWPGVTNAEELYAALQDLKIQGFAKANPEDLVSFAVAFWGRGGVLAGSVGVFLPLFRRSPEKEAEILAEIKKISKELNKFLETENINNK